jgi:hypothetical protein
MKTPMERVKERNIRFHAKEMFDLLEEILDAYIETDDVDLNESLYRKTYEVINKVEGGK